MLAVKDMNSEAVKTKIVRIAWPAVRPNNGGQWLPLLGFTNYLHRKEIDNFISLAIFIFSPPRVDYLDKYYAGQATIKI